MGNNSFKLNNSKLKNSNTKLENNKLYLPEEILNKILEYNYINFNEYNVTKKHVQNICKLNVLYFLITKKDKYNLLCKNLYIIYKLLLKYNYYQNDYEKCSSKKYYSPILLDMCFTDCNLPSAHSSFNFCKNYNNNPIISYTELKNDMKSIIKVLPSCIESDYGVLRCRFNVTPIMAASINESIPIDFVELLIKNGANINKKIQVNGYNIDLLDDLHDNINSYRHSKLVKLFNKNNKIN